jgi:hypothetical protein
MTRSRILRVAALGAVLLATASAGAQRWLADFAGVWNVTVQSPQGPLNSILTLKQSGDTVSGDFESELGKAAVSGLAKGDSLKFVFGLDMGGQQINIMATAVKDKDNLNGNMEVAGMGAFPFSAVRKP